MTDTGSRCLRRRVFGVGGCLCLLAAAAILVGCGDKKEPSRHAPDFMLHDLDGNRFYLSATSDTVVVLNFWSVHCAPCLREMPLLQRMAEHYADKPVRIIGICTVAGKGEYVSELLHRLTVTYSVLDDQDSTVYGLYGVTAEPTTVIVDRKGRIRHRTVGYAPGYIDRYRGIIDGLLHEHLQTGR